MNYLIPEANLTEFKNRIERMVRRAAKLKSNLSYAINKDIFEDRKIDFIDSKGHKATRIIRFIQVVVEGDRPKFAGWNFAGTLEHTDEGNILRLIPGETAPADLRDHPPVCNHCQLKRKRRDTFVVRSDEGKFMQVGSNCLADFLGHANPQVLAQLSSIWINVEDLSRLAEDDKWLGGGGGFGEERHDLTIFLSHVAEIVLRTGTFMSRAMVNKIIEKQGPEARVPETTAWRAAGHMLPSNAKECEEAELFAPSDAAIEMAVAARDWAIRKFGMPLPDGDDEDVLKASLMSSLGRAELTDFEHNLFVIAKGESVTRRSFGIAAYLIQAYRKDNNLIPERKAPSKPSVHFGEVGERLKKFEVVCEKHVTWQSDFGLGSLFRMLTKDGNVMVWRTYNVSGTNEMNEGKTYLVNATIKSHTVFNSVSQTEVSRLKVTSCKEDVSGVVAAVEQIAVAA